MKKLIGLLLAFMLTTVIVACGDENGVEKDEPTPESEVIEEEQNNETSEEEQTVEIDKGLLNVEITMPPSLTEGQDIEQIKADAKEAGVSEVIENEDGSITYKMSRAKHKEMVQEMEDGLNESIEEIKNSEDYVSISDVTANNSYSEFTLVVDQEAYENSFDGFAAVALGMGGMYYQLFNGVNSDDLKVTIDIVSVETGDVFDTTVYPDAFE